MINSLYIRNFALISELRLRFDKGFTTITGETGAGKSIMLGALSLLLGSRADLSVLADKDSKAIVEGEFDISEYSIQHIFEQNDVDFEPHTLIRREILPSGKSRAFVNDMPVTLPFLKEVGEYLIDVHSQHQNLLLSDNVFQISVIDVFAKNADLLIEFKAQLEKYRKVAKELKDFESKISSIRKEYDFNKHLFEELKATNIKENELEAVESEHSMLAHANEIKAALAFSVNALVGDEENIVSLLKNVFFTFKNVENVLPKATEYIARLESVNIELADIGNDLQVLAADVDVDPDRLEAVEGRLGLLYNLLKKHSCTTVNELLEVQNNLEQKIAMVDNCDEEYALKQKELDRVQSVLSEYASQISDKRKAVVPKLKTEVTSLLKGLGMPNAAFDVQILQKESYTEFGVDDISFLFSANKNSDLHKISEVASGGELSRVMLCLKFLLCRERALPSIIFDEIDTGVSGDIAEKMAFMMKDMSDNMQVICITHLPQIASQGECHFVVYKTDTEERTVTNVKRLNKEERVFEIAKMLSGKEITDAALENAKQLLN